MRIWGRTYVQYKKYCKQCRLYVGYYLRNLHTYRPDVYWRLSSVLLEKVRKTIFPIRLSGLVPVLQFRSGIVAFYP